MLWFVLVAVCSEFSRHMRFVLALASVLAFAFMIRRDKVGI